MMNFKERAIATGRNYFFVRACSICRYPLAYEVLSSDFNLLGFDAGCDCTRRSVMEHTTWERMEELYNQMPEEQKKYYDKIWWGETAEHEHQ